MQVPDAVRIVTLALRRGAIAQSHNPKRNRGWELRPEHTGQARKALSSERAHDRSFVGL